MNRREQPHNSGTRILKILINIIERPYTYTKGELAAKYGTSKESIKSDFEDLKNAGFELDFDKNYRYAFIQDKPYEYLKEMLLFSENEQGLLTEALQKMPDSRTQQKLLKKLDSIYEMSRLGNSLITKPFLNKVNLLEKAKREKKQVLLVNYHSSNSSSVADKKVEPFKIAVEEDVLHAFDVLKKEVKHYRISRITKILLQEEDWQYETRHVVKVTDPFRISDDEQVRVSIRLKVGGYNELVERFPLTRSYLTPAPDINDVYDFNCNVNHRFFGLTNFLLGYHSHIIEIIEPESLIDHLKSEIQKINTQFF